MATQEKAVEVGVVRVVLPSGNHAAMQNIASVFARQVHARCGANVTTQGEALLKVVLAVEPGIGTEGFRIAGDAGTAQIIGNDERGALYGIGKFLRTSSYGSDGFTAGMWRGKSVPQKLVRGVYFATHFYNYYQTAPVEELERYIEELALWGVNLIMMWYDMHHFNGFDDPEAAALRKRLMAIGEAGKRVGMDIGLIVIGNEAYGNSPLTLRADASDSRGGWYDCAVCPSKAGGTEYILEVLGQEFDYFAELRPSHVCIWPYDQGSCGCAKCKPWSTHGFVNIAEKIGDTARERMPGVKIVFSTWFMTKDEYRELRTRVLKDKDWVDMLIMGEFLGPAPNSEPIIGFPEISMHETFPWGGFGATPLPRYCASIWQEKKSELAGGFPYSEGIFEDISKVTFAQLYWNSNLLLEDILKEYIAYEYSPEVVDDVLNVLTILENNHHMRWWPGELEDVKLTLSWFPSKGAEPRADPGAEEAHSIMARADARLPHWARESWRWRILGIRAMLDAELKGNGGSPNEACMQGFRELMQVYHTIDKTYPVVRPPISGPDGRDP